MGSSCRPRKASQFALRNNCKLFQVVCVVVINNKAMGMANVSPVVSNKTTTKTTKDNFQLSLIGSSCRPRKGTAICFAKQLQVVSSCLCCRHKQQGNGRGRWFAWRFYIRRQQRQQKTTFSCPWLYKLPSKKRHRDLLCETTASCFKLSMLSSKQLHDSFKQCLSAILVVKIRNPWMFQV